MKADHFKVVSKLHFNGCTFLGEYGLAHSREECFYGNITYTAWGAEGLGSKVSKTLKATCTGSGALLEHPYLGTGHNKV